MKGILRIVFPRVMEHGFLKGINMRENLIKEFFRVKVRSKSLKGRELFLKVILKMEKLMD